MQKLDEDNCLIQKILSGDVAAFKTLIRKHQNFAFNLALKFTHNDRELAEEITQDAFLKAYNNLRSFRLESKFSTWLYKIIFTTSMNTKRKVNNLVIMEDFNEKYHDLSDANHYDIDLYDLKLLKHSISKAIDQLPYLDGILITLFYLNEQTIGEISIITGIDKNQIKSKLFRARVRLKSLLDLKIIKK